MKSAELKKKDKKSLMDLLAEKRTALRNVRFGTAGSKTRNVREGRAIRKTIARILTELKTK